MIQAKNKGSIVLSYKGPTPVVNTLRYFQIGTTVQYIFLHWSIFQPADLILPFDRKQRKYTNSIISIIAILQVPWKHD